MSDNPNRPPSIFEDAFLDRIQKQSPALAGPEARLALHLFFIEVSDSARHAMASVIFSVLRDTFLIDLSKINDDGLNDTVKNAMREEPALFMHDFLNHTYAAILREIAQVGGIGLVQESAPQQRKVTLEHFAEEASERDLELLSKPRGKA